jgi:SNF2 family DNA or RNA helicase
VALSKKYGKIEFTPKVGWNITEAEPHVCIKLKAMFTKIAKWQAAPFLFPDTPENCHDLLWFLDRYPLEISDKDFARLKKSRGTYIQTVNDLEAIMLPTHKPRQAALKDGYQARDYQLRGSELLLRCKRLLIGDEVGLGKTMIGIISCLEPKTLPALVVVQTHLPKQWKDEIEKFTGLKVHLVKGTKPYSLPEADVYITKYSCISGWVDVFKKGFFKMAIFDEVQELRHHSTGKYNSAEALSRSCEYVLALSATPIYNYADEIYNVLNLIKPDCLGNSMDFFREWAGNYIGNRVVIKDPAALGTYLRDSFLFLRRTREEVGRELPQINKIVHTVGYDEAEFEKEEAIVRQLAMSVMSGSFVERGQASRELDIRMRQSTGISKAKEVAAYVKILLENNEPVLLAGWHRAVYETWMRELAEYNPVLYTGSESPAEKEKSKNAFTSGETNLMIISLRSGIGLDGLQHRCRTVIFGELDYSPQVHHQVIGRVDRDGQKDQVTVVFLVSDGGSDPVIIDLLGLKSSQSHGIIDPLKAVPGQYSDESRIKLLAKQFLEKRGIAIPEPVPEPAPVEK